MQSVKEAPIVMRCRLNLFLFKLKSREITVTNFDVYQCIALNGSAVFHFSLIAVYLLISWCFRKYSFY